MKNGEDRMTKRYFKREWEVEYYIFDSQTISEKEFDEKLEYEDYKAFEDSMQGDEVVNRLNELYEERNYFERKKYEYWNKFNLAHLDNIQLRQENEQLKNKIDVLEDDNETYHKSLEKLNLYTKRFIPTKCTNEFKDCKTNRYYWLDHEGNFEGCLELLNLLDCENEVLKSENRQLKGRLMEYEEQIKGDFE